MPRDYSLTGPDARRAVDAGLVTEDWYRTPIDRKQMKALTAELNAAMRAASSSQIARGQCSG